MIKTFKCKDTEKLYRDFYVKRFDDVLNVARRKLEMLHATKILDTLTIPPSNRLEKLVGDRKGFYSIRINRQWRLCFRWSNGDAFDVEIVDYH